MKQITVTSLPNREKVKMQLLAANNSHNARGRHWQVPEYAIDEWIESWPKVGDIIKLANAQIHFNYSPVFAGWGPWSYGNMYCLDIDRSGAVQFGTVQCVGH